MKYIALFSCIMMCSCASTITVGVTISPKYDFTVDDVGEVVRFAADELGRLMPDNWTIVLVGGYIPVYNESEPGVLYLSDGAIILDKRQLLVFPYQSCLADSALIHELAHLIKYEHGKQNESVIADIHVRAVNKLCSPNYERADPPSPTIDDLTRKPIPRLWAPQESDNG